MNRTFPWLTFALLCTGVSAADNRPNIVLIMTDDMGFSDVGCYGGEIETPNIDRLAAGGVKFSQFYNCGKCEPTRAALITGHQWWTYNPAVAVRRDSPNMGEVVRTAGYRTIMVGKWHAEGVPFERGFDRHFGFMRGGTNYFLGDDTLTLDGQPWPVPRENSLTLNPEGTGDYTGGGYLLVMSADFKQRLFCTRLQGGGTYGHSIDARALRENRSGLAFGGGKAKVDSLFKKLTGKA